MTSRAWTKEEAREMFLDHLKLVANYWINEPSAETAKAKVEGFMFSVLVMFDGASGEHPAVDLVMCPHEDDKAYAQKNDENWYEPGMVINDDCHLHDMIYEAKP